MAEQDRPAEGLSAELAGQILERLDKHSSLLGEVKTEANLTRVEVEQISKTLWRGNGRPSLVAQVEAHDRFVEGYVQRKTEETRAVRAEWSQVRVVVVSGLVGAGMLFLVSRVGPPLLALLQ